METNNRYKIMLVGVEGSGKTCLSMAIRVGVTEPKSLKRSLGQRTHPSEGITVNKVATAAAQGKTSHILSIWDFAGAEIYITTHPFFFTSRSVFVICANINCPFDQSGISGWLQTVSTYAPKASIFIVGTHLDAAKNKTDALQLFEENINEIRGKHPIQGIYAISLSTGKNVLSFVETLVSYVEDLIKSEPLTADPKFQSFCEAILKIRHSRRKDITTAPILEWEQVEKIAEQQGIPSQQFLQAVKYLESVESILYFPGFADPKNSQERQKIKGYFQNTQNGILILDHNWIISLFSTVISTSALTHVQNGIISLANLKSKIWGNMVPAELHQQLLGLLQFFDIIFMFPGNQYVLIPGLLSKQYPSLASLWPAWSPVDSQMSRRYQFKVPPQGVFARIMIRLLAKYKASKCWRTGILVDTDQVLSLITLHPQDRSISVYTRSSTLVTSPVLVFIDINSIFCNILEHGAEIAFEAQAPCPTCHCERSLNPCVFPLKDCERKALENTDSITCSNGHDIPLCELVPEALLTNWRSKMLKFENIKLGQQLGQGGFATVYQGTLKGEQVAVKVLTPQNDEKQILAQHREFRGEVATMLLLDHPNILALRGFSFHPPAMILELIEHGDLHRFLNHEPKAFMDWNLQLRFAFDLASGMSYLHSLDPIVLHCDLKTPNIMLKSVTWDSPVPTTKICDFGVSKQLFDGDLKGQAAHKRDVANPCWLAPEVLSGKKRGVGVDIYAYGIILWELLCRKHPWPDYTYTSDHEKDIIAGVRPIIPTDCPDDYSALMKACWSHDPSSRPHFSAIVDVFLPRINKIKAPELSTLLASPQFVQRPSRLRSPIPPMIRSQAATLSRSRPKLVTEKSMGWKKNATSTIRSRWQHHVTEEVVTVQCEHMKQIFEKLFIMPHPTKEVFPLLLGEAEVHAKGYTVYNLTGQPYDYTPYSGQVLEYPLLNKPSLNLLNDCVNSAFSLMEQGVPILLHDEDQSTSASVLVAAGLLCRLNQAPSEHAGLTVISKRLEKKATLQPDQIRCLHYLFSTPSSGNVPLHFHKISWSHTPNFKFNGGCNPHFTVAIGDKTFFFSKDLKGQKGKKVVDFFTKDILVTNPEISISFFHKDFSKPMFNISFNLAYEKRFPLLFHKKDIGLACSDTKHFHNDFQVEVHFLDDQQLISTLDQDSSSSDWFSPRSRSTISDESFERSLEDDTSNPFAMLNRKEEFDPRLPTCKICRKNVHKSQASLTLSAGVIVHHTCMHCERCGVTFSEGSDSVLRGSHILCSQCDDEFHPPCVECGRPVRENGRAEGASFWHQECFKCSHCSRVIGSADNCGDGEVLLCSTCSKLKPRKLNRVLSVVGSTDVEEELQTFLTTHQCARDHFFRFVSDHSVFLGNAFEFWMIVREHNRRPRAVRGQAAEEIIKRFLVVESPSRLPNEVFEILKDRPLETDLSSQRLFRIPARVSLSLLAEEYKLFCVSDKFDLYILDLKAQRDPEEADNAKRMKLAQKFIPISLEQQSDMLGALEKEEKFIEAAKLDQQRLAEEKQKQAEEERKRKEAAEKAERERIEQLRREEEERLREAERLRLEKEKRKLERRLAKEERKRLEAERLENERKEAERIERERLEAIRQREEEEKRQQEQERLRLEKERRKLERRAAKEEARRLQEEERLRLQQLEEERIRKEQAKAERKRIKELERQEEEKRLRELEEERIRLKQLEEERIRKEQAKAERKRIKELKRQEEEEKRLRELEEMQRLLKEAEEKQRRAQEKLEKERRRRKQEERRKKEEEERLRLEEEKRIIEAERLKREEEERLRQEAERKRLEEEQRLAEENRKREERERRRQKKEAKKREQERLRAEEEQRLRAEEARRREMELKLQAMNSVLKNRLQFTKTAESELASMGLLSDQPSSQETIKSHLNFGQVDFVVSGPKEATSQQIHLLQIKCTKQNQAFLFNPFDWLNCKIVFENGKWIKPWMKDLTKEGGLVILGFQAVQEGRAELRVSIHTQTVCTFSLKITTGPSEQSKWLAVFPRPVVGSEWLIDISKTDALPNYERVEIEFVGLMSVPQVHKLFDKYRVAITPSHAAPLFISIRIDNEHAKNSPIKITPSSFVSLEQQLREMHLQRNASFTQATRPVTSSPPPQPLNVLPMGQNYYQPMPITMFQTGGYYHPASNPSMLNMNPMMTPNTMMMTNPMSNQFILPNPLMTSSFTTPVNSQPHHLHRSMSQNNFSQHQSVSGLKRSSTVAQFDQNR